MLPEYDREVLIMMTLERFRALTGSYGAELERWPQEERGAAQELLRSSEEARTLLEHERSLDKAIAAATAYQDTKRWPGDPTGAVSRLRSGVAARIATEEVRAGSGGWLGWLLGGASDTSSVRVRRVGLATSGAFAIIAGLLVGGMYAPAPAPVGALSALLQPASLEILAD